MMIPLNIRIDKKLGGELDRYAREKGLDKAAFLRGVIRKGLQLAKEETLLKEYAKKNISMGEVCRRLGISPWDFFELLKNHNAYLNVDLEDFLSASRF